MSKSIRESLAQIRQNLKNDPRLKFDTPEIRRYFNRMQNRSDLNRREMAEARIGAQLRAIRAQGWILCDQEGEVRTDHAFYARPGSRYRIAWGGMPDRGPYIMQVTETGDINVSHPSGEVVPLVYHLCRQGAGRGRTFMVLPSI